MKQAFSTNGRPIVASAHAPEEAICPSCGGVVTLRQRRRMGNAGISYYWRHRRNRNQYCPRRSQQTHIHNRKQWPPR